MSSEDCKGGFLPTTWLDRQYGETATIDAIWIFKEKIEAERMKEGLELLATELPSLSGRINSKKCGIDLSNEGVHFYVQEASGSWDSIPQEIEQRKKFIERPAIADLFNGNAPVLTVVLTHLIDGGCILGVAASHMIAGGSGFFGYVMPRLAALVRTLDSNLIQAGELGYDKPIEDRSCLPQANRSLADLKEIVSSMENPPMSFRDPIFGSIKRMAMYSFCRNSRDRERVFVHFCPKEVSSIKNEILSSSRKLKWISSANAVIAHLTKIAASLSNSWTTEPSHAGLVIDHVSKLKHLPKGLMANTFYLYSCNFKKRITKSTTTEVAEQLHETIQDVVSNEQALIDEMEFEEDCLKWDYQLNPKLTLGIPIIVNNQSKFTQLIDLDFGAGPCERYIPHKAGDSLLLVPAKDGGLDVWISTVNSFAGNPLRLLQPEFQKEIHKYR